MRRLVAAAASVLALSSVGTLTAQTPPAAPPAAPAAAGVTKVKVGAYIQNLSKLDLVLGKYSVDVTLDFKTADANFGQTIDILNGDIEKEGGKAKVTKIDTGDPGLQRYRVQAEITLDVDFRRYPFDRQDLSISIFTPDHDTKAIVFESDGENVDREQKVKVAGWNLSEPESGDVSEESFDEANVKYSVYTIPLSMSRPMISATTKTFLPLTVMLLISMLALILGAGAAPARLSTVTGTLLGAVMFHLSTTSSLPPLGYVTLTDKIFIAAYASFLVNLFFTAEIIKNNDQKNETKVKELLGKAKTMVPVATVAFIVIGFILGML